MITAVMNANLSNCVKKPETVRTSTGFEPVTSRYRCDALTNWAMKPLTLDWAMKPLSFSGFYTQLLKFAFITAMIIAYLISNPQFNIWNISYITSVMKWLRRPVPNSASAILPYLVHFISSSHSLSKNLIQIINLILIKAWSKWFSVKQRWTTDSVGVITRFAITRNVSQIILA